MRETIGQTRQARGRRVGGDAVEREPLELDREERLRQERRPEGGEGVEREEETVVVHAHIVAKLLDHALDAEIDEPELATRDRDGCAPPSPERERLLDQERLVRPRRRVVGLGLGVRQRAGDANARDADRVPGAGRAEGEVRAERDVESIGKGQRRIGG